MLSEKNSGVESWKGRQVEMKRERRMMSKRSFQNLAELVDGS